MTDAANLALQLLFKKLHPHLEDAAHALTSAAPRKELERLHQRLMGARAKAAEALLGLEAEGPLAEALEALGEALEPQGETYRESLVLTQLCLEQALEDVLPGLSAEALAQASWAPRMEKFKQQMLEPGMKAETRWLAVEEDIGEAEDPWD